MSDQYNWYFYIQQLQEMIQKQNNTISKLEEKVNTLEKLVKDLKDKPSQTVEYKFDQLKIEKLEGTLNIGLSQAGDGKNIEEFTVGKNNIYTASAELGEVEEPVYREIMESLDLYFKDEIIKEIQRLEEERSLPLEESYRSFMLEDVYRQIPERLKHYLKKYSPNTEEERIQVLNKTKEDILKGIASFMDHIKDHHQQGGQGDELSGYQP